LNSLVLQANIPRQNIIYTSTPYTQYVLFTLICSVVDVRNTKERKHLSDVLYFNKDILAHMLFFSEIINRLTKREMLEYPFIIHQWTLLPAQCSSLNFPYNLLLVSYGHICFQKNIDQNTGLEIRPSAFTASRHPLTADKYSAW
jgi:hypothetical protein